MGIFYLVLAIGLWLVIVALAYGCQYLQRSESTR